MERLSKKLGAVVLSLLLCTACTRPEGASASEEATVQAYESPEELYQKALKEDVLIVYTVSTRLVQTKESFEAAYPGLSVEVRDLRSPSLIEAVEADHAKGLSECDVVLCNDNSGEFQKRLVDTGLVRPYLPEDIASHMKEGMDEESVSFLMEAEMLFYNSALYDSCPVSNLWELTEERFRGRIYMPNPLNSFATYALCGAVMQQDETLAEAYRLYTGGELSLSEGETVSEHFWKEAAANIVFTNSSDEVLEALGDGEADLGICVSSKLRYRDLGYSIEPVWKLTPFSGCRTSYAVMMAAEPKNENTAKLFIRYLFGEADGKGEGYTPFCSAGTWSVREDVADGSDVPLSDTDFIAVDQKALIGDREHMESFWSQLIRESGNTQ